MDPDQALTDIRDRIPAARRSQSRQIAALAESFEALDEWLSNDGFKPKDWAARVGRPRLKEDGVVLPGVTHGTPSGYNRGCHCLDCRRSNTQRRAEARARAQQ